MSPLGAVRELADRADPFYVDTYGMHCFFCAAEGDDHDPACFWLALPRIVTALEAYERMADQMADQCPICRRAVQSGLGTYPWTCANGHTLYFGGGTLSARNRMPPSERTEVPS